MFLYLTGFVLLRFYAIAKAFIIRMFVRSHTLMVLSFERDILSIMHLRLATTMLACGWTSLCALLLTLLSTFAIILVVGNIYILQVGFPPSALGLSSLWGESEPDSETKTSESALQ